jgi:DNA polymerase III subunit epsilon
MIEIVLDTETTGLDPKSGHRIVEIGCVELNNYIPTGRHFHRYMNPERDVPAEAVAVHGLNNEFLSKHPTFSELIDDFLAFIGDHPLVIHNAAFDMGFLNAELTRYGFPVLPMTRAIDTVPMVRRKFPGASASLDALCKRYNIDLSGRKLHGALLDAELLAAAYLELRGGKQQDMMGALNDLESRKTASTSLADDDTAQQPRNFRSARAFPISAAEEKAHEAFVATLKNPLWKK